MPLKSRYRRVLDGAIAPSFKLDLSTAVFSAGMSKRNSAGPFASGVMLQGARSSSGTPDSLSFSRGNQISGNFYQNMDWDQGSIALWLTPEWSSTDGATHNIFEFGSGTGGIRLDKNLNGITYFYYGGQTLSVGSYAWTEGTTYSVVVRYNNHITLDGTNYACVSINDSHTFGIATAPSVSLADNQQIGASSGTSVSASSVIEGLTVYRRCLYDGAYGTNVGNGDEINLIYNAGTGQDPTLVTGSWDVVFCLPTNSTVAALTTGTGEAWSHPHSSNALKRGWMDDGLGYIGNPFSVSCNGTSTLINCGSDASVDNLADNEFTAEMWVRSDAGTENRGYIGKGSINNRGWYILSSFTIAFTVPCATTNAVVTCTSINDRKWHHIAVYFNDAGDRRAYMAIDGVWTTGSAGVGAIKTDSADLLYFGGVGGYYTLGNIGWARISNNDRYSHGTSFIPSKTPPIVDANTLTQWNLTEGYGTTVTNLGSNGSLANGTIVSGSWEPQWMPVGPNVPQTSVLFNGTNTSINAGSASSVDELFRGSVTVEGWFRSPVSASAKYIITKSSTSTWYVRVNANGTVEGKVTTNASSSTATSSVRFDNNQWHHFAFTYNDAGDRIARLYVDGSLVGTGATNSGVVVSDAANSLYIGDGPSYFSGALGWIRISNNIRYSATFTPTQRNMPPVSDSNTIRLFRMDNGGIPSGGYLGVLGTTNTTSSALGSGTTVIDSSSYAQNATLSNGTWSYTPAMAIDSPGSRTYQYGYMIGSYLPSEGIKQTLGTNSFLEMCANPGFETLGAGGSDVFANWTETIPGDSTIAAENSIVHSGSYAARMVRTATSSPTLAYVFSTSNATKYRLRFWTRGSGGGAVRYALSGGYTLASTTTDVTGTTYTEVIYEFTTTSATSVTLSFTLSSAGTNYIDDVSLKQYDLGLGADYVVKASTFSGDVISQPQLEIYDETNGATITSITSFGSQNNLALTPHFEADTNWTKGTGWSIADSRAHKEPPTVSNLSQNIGVLPNRYYKVTYTVLNYESGSINIGIGTSTANGTARSTNGTYTETILSPSGADGSLYFIANATFHGDLDDVIVTLIPDSKNPEQLLISFELPTISRNGVALDCVSFSVRLLSTTAGITGWNQVELLSNLLDNPSMDIGSSNPWIPSGWVNDGLDSGDSSVETSITRSGKGIRFNTGSSNEGIYQNVSSIASGKYYIQGAFMKSDGTSTLNVSSYGTSVAPLQSSISGSAIITTTTPWKHVSAIFRQISSTTRYIRIMCGAGAVGSRYVDDTYTFVLDDVTITTTPASSSNSLELTGIRVDGSDTLAQSIPTGLLKSTNGTIKFKYTPRHSSSTAVLFGVGSATRIAYIYYDANNMITLDRASGSVLRLGIVIGGVSTSVDQSYSMSAGTEYPIKLVYTPSGLSLYINNALVIGPIGGSINFGTSIPNNAYWGSFGTQLMQDDAVFSAP